MTKDKYHIQRVSELKQHRSASFIIEWWDFFGTLGMSII